MAGPLALGDLIARLPSPLGWARQMDGPSARKTYASSFPVAGRKNSDRLGERGVLASLVVPPTIRAEGPAFYLAQPNGLGKRYNTIARANGPAVCPMQTVYVTNGRAVGPTNHLTSQVPSPLGWARQTNGALPPNQKAQLQNSRFGL